MISLQILKTSRPDHPPFLARAARNTASRPASSRRQGARRPCLGTRMTRSAHGPPHGAAGSGCDPSAGPGFPALPGWIYHLYMPFYRARLDAG